ncbi:hypothetical protein FVE85_4790 [Porphyridium purpureum]|uniref:Uncharacterized protein n=1 Tax=Porphyridium purpureum TaxID=35688 RepID=A0A5J4YS65_PORPP|nr:hypothetical protein FVE85_4790 [Porphyridium purpureum]|eukprot:POR7034..scf236_6
MGGLDVEHELAVAVVDEEDDVWADVLDELHNARNVVHGERRAERVAARALDEHHARLRAQRGLYGVELDEAERAQVELAVRDAKVAERAGVRGALVVRAAQADDLLERVVRPARDAEQLVARAEDAEQRGGDGVRARDELGPHERLLAVEEACEDGVDDLPAEVAVAVAFDAGEVVRADAVRAVRGEQPPERGLRAGVDARKRGRGARAGARRATRRATRPAARLQRGTGAGGPRRRCAASAHGAANAAARMVSRAERLRRTPELRYRRPSCAWPRLPSASSRHCAAQRSAAQNTRAAGSGAALYRGASSRQRGAARGRGSKQRRRSHRRRRPGTRTRRVRRGLA